jgi:hypothetical protein
MKPISFAKFLKNRAEILPGLIVAIWGKKIGQEYLNNASRKNYCLQVILALREDNDLY